MLEDIKAVIFDLDGTLVDSMWMWEDIDIEYLARFQRVPTPDLHVAIEGMGFSETAAYFKEAFDLEDSVEQIKADWLELARGKYATEVPLKPGVIKFLEELKNRNIRTGIATSNGRALVNAVMKAQNLDRYIQVVRTACEVAKGKPAPDIYLKVAEDLQAEPKQCLVFEDVPMGILAGKNAGMKVCAVADRYSAAQSQKIRALADYFIETYDAVLENTYEVLTDE